jgi:hypothetical protein
MYAVCTFNLTNAVPAASAVFCVQAATLIFLCLDRVLCLKVAHFVFVGVGVSLRLIILITVACRSVAWQRLRNKLNNIIFRVLLMAFNSFLLLLCLLYVCVCVCVCSLYNKLFMPL